MTYAQESRGDRSALEALFAIETKDANALEVHRYAKTLPFKERYDYLVGQVLPTGLPNVIRLEYAFSPTNAAPPVSGPIASRTWVKQQRAQTGGQLVSPAVDLVETARELDLLEELKRQVRQRATEPDPSSLRKRLALTLLIDIARKDGDAVNAALDQFLPMLEFDSTTGPSPEEWLVFSACVEQEGLDIEVGSPIYRYHRWTEASPPPTVEQLQWAHLIGRSKKLLVEVLRPSDPKPREGEVRMWEPVSPSNAKNNAEGIPPVRWDLRPGYLQNVASQTASDFLLYRIPMRGDFEIEGEVTMFGWLETSFFIGGHWFGPHYQMEDVSTGRLLQSESMSKLPAKLTRPKRWVRFRVVVRGNQFQAYLNGMPAYSRMISDFSEPWIGIHSSLRHDGGARDIRITGQPVIPQELALLTNSRLDNWVDYYSDNPGTRTTHWRMRGDELTTGETRYRVVVQPNRTGSSFGARLLGRNSETVMVADSPNRSPGSADERLLRHYRPLWENGVVSYEFYYEPDQTHVHPAIGRVALLLDPDGVKRHWITDGKHDRTELSPTNADALDPDRSEPLPLIPNSWNTMQMRLQDETCELSLNGVVIGRATLSPTNQREFGFFHFADRTDVRVRNVTYLGEWPTKVPPVDEQEMALHPLGFLDDMEERLTARFDFRFPGTEALGHRFDIYRGDPSRHFAPDPGGLLVSRTADGSYQAATICPKLRIGGDFDITVEYDQFGAVTEPDENTGLSLLTVLDNETRDEHYIERRQEQRKDGSFEQHCHCVEVRRFPEREARRHFSVTPMEEHAGRMRLIRRGQTIYYLTAQHDSPHFQLRGQTAIETDDIAVDGLRLVAMNSNVGSVSVCWKSLSVHAERLSGPAIEPAGLVVEELNASRAKLPQQFMFDFDRSPPVETAFQLRDDDNPWNAADPGWKIRARGGQGWSASGLHLRRTLKGDFDISVHFEVTRWAEARPNARTSVYLQLEFPNGDTSQNSLIFAREPGGILALKDQLREKRPDGSPRYYSRKTIGTLPLRKLRIARRGDRMYHLGTVKSSGREFVLSEFPASRAPLYSSSVRFMLHSGNREDFSEVILKSIDVRATAIEKPAVIDIFAQPLRPQNP